MKLVYIASDRIEAEIVSGKLNANDISNTVNFDDQNGLRPFLSLTQGVKIFVLDEDFDEATRILRQ